MSASKFYISLFFLVVITNGIAQDHINQYDKDDKRHGVWTKNYAKTNLKRYSGVFKHGKEIDTFKYYKTFKNKSVLSAIRVFNENDKLSEVTFYASNKTIISQGKMNGKLFIGPWVFYHKNTDVIMISEHYNTEGRLNGIRKVFYKNGNLAEVLNYNNGKLDGEAKWYSDNNTLIKLANYNNDEFDGKYIMYNSTGKKTTAGTYTNGKKSGIWHFTEAGKTTTKDYSIPKN